MKCLLEKPKFYLAMLIIGSNLGCTDIRNRDVTQAQPDANNTEQNSLNQVAT